MKIIYVITSLDYGGTQKQLYYIVRYIRQTFPEIKQYIISLKNKNKYKEKFYYLKVPVFTLNLPDKISIFSFFYYPILIIKFFLLVKTLSPEIIFSFLFQANFIVRFIKLISSKIKTFCSERVTEKEKKFHIFISRWTNFLVDKIIVNSEQLKKFVISSQRVPESKVIVLKNFIDPQEIKIKISPEDVRNQLGVDKDTILVLSAGRLHKQKGYELLIDIARKISTCVKNIKFVVIGDGEEFKNLVYKVEKYRLEKIVNFVGYKENVYDYINACDIFVLTSLWEGSPNVVLEAMMFNKPIVTTEVSGVRELLGDDYSYIIPLSREREKIVISFTEALNEIIKNQPKFNYKEKIDEFINFHRIKKDFLPSLNLHLM